MNTTPALSSCLLFMLCIGSGGCSNGSSCEPISGVWTLTDLTCNGRASPSAGGYALPNRTTSDFSSSTTVVETNDVDGCNATFSYAIAYTSASSCAFTATPAGASTCNPSACNAACPGGAGAQGSDAGDTAARWTYVASGDRLTLTTTAHDVASTWCPAGGTIVETFTQGGDSGILSKHAVHAGPVGAGRATKDAAESSDGDVDTGTQTVAGRQLRVL